LLQNFVLKHLHRTHTATVHTPITEPIHRINTVKLKEKKSLKVR
jgi:hypothetical protein